MSSSTPPTTNTSIPSPNPRHRLQRAPVTPPPERPSWYPVDDKPNSEANHIRALEEAHQFHERIREKALAVLHLSNAEAQLASLQAEEARVFALEQANVEAARKTKELNDRTAAIEAQTQAQIQQYAQAQAQAQAAINASTAAATAQIQNPPAVVAPQASTAPVPTPSSFAATATPTQAPTQAPLAVVGQPTPASATQAPNLPPPSQMAPPSQPAPAVVSQPGPSGAAQPPHQVAYVPFNAKKNNPVVHPDNDLLRDVHQELKNLRRSINDAFIGDPAFKKKVGEMRRSIRMSVGQLTGSETDQSQNKFQVDAIMKVLDEALSNKVRPLRASRPEDFTCLPDNFIVDLRDPVPGAVNNGNLPDLFLFLLNHFAKAVVNQLAEEAGVKPHMAASIGIVAVKIFSKIEYLWRGQSLIDILMSKYRMVCPVLFGIRGRETTEAGRIQLGWKRINGRFIDEEAHATRMTGFGAGYAAICLRDFSRSTRLRHPYAVSRYWQAMASIIATPAESISRTQCFVLRAMIDGYEEKFLRFYGSAALAALQIATVHFPARVPVLNEATNALKAMPAKMKHQIGIDVIEDAFRQ